MPKEQIRYFRAEKNTGTAYFAAASEEAVRRLLGDLKFPGSPAQLFGYRLDTLVEIPELDAKQAPDFEDFARTYKLCSDGTWMLGLITSKSISTR